MTTKIKKYRYSEIFGKTIQGEGQYTGIPTAWIRFFGCNLECNGFGQTDPTDPSSYELPYQKIDIADITDITALPVFEYGCDSSYSWSKKYRHLAHLESAEDICVAIENTIKSPSNPRGLFHHPKSNQHIHMCFTGGEPIMSQHAMLDIMQNFQYRSNEPMYVTVETNGTQDLKDPLYNFISKEWGGVEWFWSISPKLFTTSGEKDAVCPEIVRRYADASPHGQLKFVVNGSDKTWDEVEKAVQEFRRVGINWDVWIMPVGATGAGQESIQATVCEQAFERGYNFAARVHAWVFDNVIGK